MGRKLRNVGYRTEGTEDSGTKESATAGTEDSGTNVSETAELMALELQGLSRRELEDVGLLGLLGAQQQRTQQQTAQVQGIQKTDDSATKDSETGGSQRGDSGPV